MTKYGPWFVFRTDGSWVKDFPTEGAARNYISREYKTSPLVKWILAKGLSLFEGQVAPQKETKLEGESKEEVVKSDVQFRL